MLEDGEPADPAAFVTAIPTWQRAMRSLLASTSSASASSGSRRLA
jgi:hypothetical protein